MFPQAGFEVGFVLEEGHDWEVVSVVKFERCRG
jgi:hypothetical protein